MRRLHSDRRDDPEVGGSMTAQQVSDEMLEAAVREYAAASDMDRGSRMLAALEAALRHAADAPAAVELDRLRRWKAEASVVLIGWERVHEALGRPGIGQVKSEAVLAEVERLRKYAPSPEMEAVLDRSSFGTDEAETARESVSPDSGRAVVRMAELMRERDFRATQVDEIESVLEMVKDRLDEFTYDELSSIVSDAPSDDHGDTIRSPLRRERDEARTALGAVAALADEWEAATDDGEWQDRLRAVLAPVSGAVEVEHVLRPDHAEVMADLTARAHAATSPGQAFYLAALAVHYARGETFPVDSAYAGIVRARRIVEDISGVGIKDHALYGPDAVAKPDDSHDLSAARKSLIEAVARRLCRLDGVWDEDDILPASYGENIPAWDEYTGRAYEVLDEVDESQWLADRVGVHVVPVAKHEQEVAAKAWALAFARLHRPNYVTEEIGPLPLHWRTRVKCDGDDCGFYAEDDSWYVALDRHSQHVADMLTANLAARTQDADPDTHEQGDRR